MWFPIWFPLPGDVEENTPIIKPKKVRYRCAGCGKFMKNDNLMYMYIMTMRCHMRQRCIYNTYLKAKAQLPKGKLANTTDKDYGKV